MADARYVEWLVRLLAFIGGAASTVAGSWISSKIRVYHDNRKAHLEDLKQRVLVPLRDGLEEHFRPLVFHLTSVVRVEMGAATEFRERAGVTESPEERGDVLAAAFPGSLVFGPLDSALLHDATKVHFRKQMDRVNTFVTRWMAHAGECHAWVQRMAREILTKSDLPAFPPKVPEGVVQRSYVMHLRLAAFIYRRLFHLPTEALRTSDDGAYWTLNGQQATLACGPKTKVEALVVMLDKLRESEEATARSMRDKAGDLQTSFVNLIPELDHAVASRRLRKRCDLVTFL